VYGGVKKKAGIIRQKRGYKKMDDNLLFFIIGVLMVLVLF
jgi:hypothetical protein